jgi:hypothetical protein
MVLIPIFFALFNPPPKFIFHQSIKNKAGMVGSLRDFQADSWSQVFPSPQVKTTPATVRKRKSLGAQPKYVSEQKEEHMAKILIIIAPERFRDEELFVTKDELEKAGHETVISSIAKGICSGSRGGFATANLKTQTLKFFPQNRGKFCKEFLLT